MDALLLGLCTPLLGLCALLPGLSKKLINVHSLLANGLALFRQRFFGLLKRSAFFCQTQLHIVMRAHPLHQLQGLPGLPSGLPLVKEGLNRAQGVGAFGVHTRTVGHAVGGTDAGHMGKGGVARHLEPEIPVFVQVQRFVKTATQCEQFPTEQHGMDGHEVAGELADTVIRQVHHLALRLAPRAQQRDAGVGRQAGRQVLQHMRQPGNMPGQQPVVVVEEQQKLATRLRQRPVGGLAARQRQVGGYQTQLKRTTARRQALMPGLCRHHHHFNVRVGLHGHRIKRLLQILAVHAANQYRDERQAFTRCAGGGAAAQRHRLCGEQAGQGGGEVCCRQQQVGLGGSHLAGQCVGTVQVERGDVAAIVLLRHLRGKTLHGLLLGLGMDGDVEQQIGAQGAAHFIEGNSHASAAYSFGSGASGLPVVGVDFPGRRCVNQIRASGGNFLHQTLYQILIMAQPPVRISPELRLTIAKHGSSRPAFGHSHRCITVQAAIGQDDHADGYAVLHMAGNGAAAAEYLVICVGGEHQRVPGGQLCNSLIRNEIGFHRVQGTSVSPDS